MPTTLLTPGGAPVPSATLLGQPCGRERSAWRNACGTVRSGFALHSCMTLAMLLLMLLVSMIWMPAANR